jgi:hypothetical protein
VQHLIKMSVHSAILASAACLAAFSASLSALYNLAALSYLAFCSASFWGLGRNELCWETNDASNVPRQHFQQPRYRQAVELVQ